MVDTFPGGESAPDPAPRPGTTAPGQPAGQAQGQRQAPEQGQVPLQSGSPDSVPDSATARPAPEQASPEQAIFDAPLAEPAAAPADDQAGDLAAPAEPLPVGAPDPASPARRKRRRSAGSGSGSSSRSSGSRSSGRSRSKHRSRRGMGAAPTLAELIPGDLALGGIVPVVAGLLLVALLVGGGGSPAPIAELMVQIAAIAALAWTAFLRDSRFSLAAALRRDPVVAGAGLLLAVMMIVQLVPLPAGLWASLPGRGPIAENMAAFTDRASVPLSIAPTLTAAALLSLLAPLAGYLMAGGTRITERNWWGPALALFAGATILLEMLQLSGKFYLYPTTSDTFARGFQANRNAQGDILAILLAALLCRPFVGESRASFSVVQGAASAVLVFAAVLTGSRAGLAMALALALAVAGREAWAWRAAAGKRLALYLAGGLVLVAGAGAALLGNANVAATLDRFGKGQESRTAVIWPDAWYAAQQFTPWGSGFGSFVPAFKIFESQELLDDSVANRAHNELLELLIEGGYPAVALALLALALVCWRGGFVMRRGITPAARARGATLLVVSLLMAAHSMVDYPIRAMSIATLWAVLLGLVTADRGDVLAGVVPPEVVRRREGRTLKSNIQRAGIASSVGDGNRLRMAAALAVLVLVVLPATVVSGFDRAERSLPGGLSCLLPAPHSCRREMAEVLAHTPGADLSAVTGPLARRYPADAALQALHGSQLRMQNKAEGYVFLHNSARLGWREPIGQLSAFELATADGDVGRAVMHIDALMRTQPEMIDNPGLLDKFLAVPAVRAQWAARLRSNPKYAPHLLASIARTTRIEEPGDSAEAARWAARIDLLAQAHAAGLRFDEDSLERAITLAWRGDRARAGDLWAAAAGAGGWGSGKPAWSVTPAAGPLQESFVPFAWAATQGNAGVLAVERGGSGGARFVVARVPESGPGKMAEIDLFLAPGPHELRWRTRGAAPAALFPMVACQKGGNADYDLLDPPSTDVGVALVTVRDGCGSATVAIARGSAALARGASIADIEIDRKRLLD